MMTRSLLCASMAAGLLAPAPLSAQSGRNCAPREVVIERLAAKYGESRRSIGLGQRGLVMETFASPDTGTWTITLTTPAGLTCLVASGQSFEALAEAVPETGSGA